MIKILPEKMLNAVCVTIYQRKKLMKWSFQRTLNDWIEVCHIPC